MNNCKCTLLLIICPSLYKAHPDILIGPNSSGLSIVAPQPDQVQIELPDLKCCGRG